MSKSAEEARQYQQEWARKCSAIEDEDRRQQWEATNDFFLPDQETNQEENE